MFELSIALKYLIPRKKQLSVSLIALMSVGVISLVVWLALIFLSVTEGIEKNWLGKLTALNAPLRITPTEEYYNSYYYLVDNYSSSSNFSYKNILQKANAPVSDPYSLEEDRELPRGFPGPERDANGNLIDPVKTAYQILNGLTFQDFEISGALMRLQFLRESAHRENTQSYLTQVSYLASLPNMSPSFSSLLLSPTEKDLNHLFYVSSHTTEYAREDAPSLTLTTSADKIDKRLKDLLKSVQIDQVQNSSNYLKLPFALLPENKAFDCIPRFRDAQIISCLLPQDIGQYKHERSGKLWRDKDTLFFQEKEGKAIALGSALQLFSQGPISFKVKQTLFPSELHKTQQINFQVTGALQKHALEGVLPFENLQITKANWLKKENGMTLLINEEKETGVLLAKNYRDSGVMIGDRGYLSYNSATPSSIQEQRLPIFVSGFYDPGILSVGSRCILVPSFVTQTINASNTTFNLDKTQANGLLVWFKDIENAEKVKSDLQQKFAKAGISKYWKVSTFREYDFAKDLLQQFQSDKYLFTLVTAIILIVACCNIISLLTLLVNDKKKEIGILQAMGASTKSIAWIFGICGMVMGILSGIIGTGAAYITLKNLDSIVHLLSLLQGHEAFNAAFFGSSLPNDLSSSAFKFICIITPLLSLLAGLIPALKACRLRPSEILRSE